MSQANPTCAVLLPQMASERATYDRRRASVKRAIAAGTGPFGQVVIYTLDCRHPSDRLVTAYNRAAERAESRHIQWLLVLGPEDLLAEGAFQHAAAYIQRADAIVGRSARVYLDRATRRQSGPSVGGATQESTCGAWRLADPLLVPHSGYLIRASLAREILYGRPLSEAGDLAYVLALLRSQRAVRIPEVLGRCAWTSAMDAAQSPARQQRMSQVQSLLGDDEEAGRVVSIFEQFSQTFRFLVNNPLDMIQKYHLGGLLWEESELRFLLNHVRPGATILDVGSHIGNHAVFYSKCLSPSRLLLIEPNPTAIAHLKHNLLLNDVKTADLSKLGIGAGRHEGRATFRNQISNNTGATELSVDGGGPVPIAPLDALVAIDDRVDFIKIDVEHMELDVLAGAEGLLRRWRPDVLVEVKNETTAAFLNTIDAMDYRVVERFANPIETNFFIRASQTDPGAKWP